MAVSQDRTWTALVRGECSHNCSIIPAPEIDQLINQSINQSVSPSVSQSFNQSIIQSIIQSITHIYSISQLFIFISFISLQLQVPVLQGSLSEQVRSSPDRAVRVRALADGHCVVFLGKT